MALDTPAGSALTNDEWDIIQSLVGTGADECPWSREGGWPADIGYEEVEVITAKFRRFIKAVKEASNGAKARSD